MPSEHDHSNIRKHTAMYVGVVVSNKDPKKLGRVRVRIGGVLPDSGGAWALPLGGFNGGAAQRGFYAVPPEGADVAVWFHQGDIDHPYYMASNWGEGETPEELDDSTVKEATQVQVLETDRWRIALDNRDGKEQLQLKDKTSGDAIEIDGVQFGVRIKGTAAVLVESDALVSVDAPMVQIAGRPVVKNGKPIN